MPFTHLHVHTEFSLLDGACRIRDLPKVVKEMGQTACAITDHGVMYGCVDFYRACKAEGIKPIIGCEVYVAAQGRKHTDKVHEYDSSSRHLVLLCENEEGYQNLSYLVSKGWTDGFYIRPRIDQDLLREHHQGLIALSACLAGEIPKQLMQSQYDKAKAYALEMAELFGEDHFYLEVQDHGIKEQAVVNREMLRLHEETGIPLICTNDAHYLKKEDAEAHDVLLCIQTGKLLDDENRMRYEPRNFYLRSEAEMEALFRDYPDAIANTQKVTDLCNLEFTFGKYHLPEFPLPEGYDAFGYMKELCLTGYRDRYGDDDTHLGQLKYEQDMIEQMGFTDYFLIVSDFVRYARSVNIPVGPGRGSAAGSMVSYCLGITDIDPMAYNLYFERFLNPERVSMPDIDMDFGDTRRAEVVEYVRQKYGANRVAQIITFGTMAARGVLRDVGRVMNLPYAQVDTIAKLVPNTLHITLKEALKLSKPLADLYNADPQVKALIDMAQSLEGMPRNASTHAAGVVITKRPVYEYVPLAKNDEALVCQYVMTTLEELGLLKMDFLGLRNLTVLEDAMQMVRRYKPDFSMADVSETDSETFEMIGSGRTSGVFQMESTGMTGVCVGLKPQNIEDLTAIIALYRPGPMESIPRFISCKHNPNNIVYLHETLEPILSITYGCIVYQEQVIEIFRRLAGYSLGQADMVRRAISKKKAKEIEKEKQAFILGDLERNIGGCVNHGIPQAIAEKIYQEIYDFANYAFNKAHAVSYAVVAYQTAWFKCHYPAEYMAALLSSVLDNSDKVSIYINECKECNIPLYPPDINRSCDCFTVEDGGIRFGLVAIKNIGRGFILRMMDEREKSGDFTSLQDFCQRMTGLDMNKRAVENLIRAGAFASLGAKRSQLMAVYESVMDGEGVRKKQNLEGQLDFFAMAMGDAPPPAPTASLPNIPEYSAKELMMMEKETTGLYLSGHPMDGYREQIKQMNLPTIGAVLEDFAQEGGATRFRDGQYVKLAGVVTSSKTKTTKNQSLMAYVVLEDATGSIESLCFSRTLEASGSYLQENQSILLEGKLSVRDEKAPQILCNTVTPLDHIPVMAAQATPQPGTPKRLYVKCPSWDSSQTEQVRKTLLMFPGDVPVTLLMADTRKQFASVCGAQEGLVQALGHIVGQEQVALKCW